MSDSYTSLFRLTRRRLLVGASSATALACRSSSVGLGPGFGGHLAGIDPRIAHRLRSNGALPAPSEQRRTTVAVVGAGVAGLSAVWRLVRAGIDDITVFELGNQPGGTAASGHTRAVRSHDSPADSDTAFPWGAHYLPVPNAEATCVIRLCREIGLLAGNDTTPTFAAQHLVHAPEDRLFYRGRWYDSLYLHSGATDRDLKQRERFERLMTTWQRHIGRDGRPAFALPAALSSQDPDLVALDRVTADQWLSQHGFDSPRLRWYCRYAVRDDYGAGLQSVSAWSLLHYFAGRRPLRAPETEGSHYFTWPEGNGRLVDWLSRLVPTLLTGQLVLRASPDGRVLVWDTASERAVEWEAEHVVLAVPNHVAARVVPGRATFADHAPWVVANLALSRRPRSTPPGWNHVIYESDSQGYVDARHQSFDRNPPTVWTWYRPFSPPDRGMLLQAGWRTLSALPLADLLPVYSDLRPELQRVDVMRWGHGTVIPAPGLQFGDPRRRANQSLARLHFAHTDYSGLPLFEEANYRGVLAAERILDRLGTPFERWADEPTGT